MSDENPTHEEMEANRVRVSAIADRMLVPVASESVPDVFVACIELATRLVTGAQGCTPAEALEAITECVEKMKLSIETGRFIPSDRC